MKLMFLYFLLALKAEEIAKQIKHVDPQYIRQRRKSRKFYSFFISDFYIDILFFTLLLGTLFKQKKQQDIYIEHRQWIRHLP